MGFDQRFYYLFLKNGSTTFQVKVKKEYRMEVLWVPIEDFPNYLISNFGDVMNEYNGRILNLSRTLDGTVKVNLLHEGFHYTRSVKVLVAEAFVKGQTSRINTPIQLDGNQENNRADNIVWRSRSFALNYARQFNDVLIWQERGPIRDVETGEIYLSIYDAAVVNGLLFQDIWKSLRYVPVHKTPPTWQTFEFM